VRELTIVTIGLALLAVAWTLLFLVARTVVTRRSRARAAALERMRRPALQIAYSDELPDVADLDKGDFEALSTLVMRYGRRVRGEPRERLADFVERSGIAADQRRELSRRGAWRRATAAFALGDAGDRDAIPALLVALDDRDRAVRIAAAHSLGSLGAVEAVDPLVESIEAGRIPWIEGGQALIELGSGAAPALRALAADPTSPLRARAIELLGHVGGPGDAHAVQEALAEESPELREQAARALGELGARDSTAALRRALGDPEPAVASAAAASLGATGAHDVVDDLLAVARSGSFEAARAAATAAARIDPRAVVAAAEQPGAGPHVEAAADLARI
jgi:HEAT repeat protein